MGQDQAAQARHLDREARLFARHVGPAEQQQRQAFIAFVLPVAFQRGDLGGLVLERVQAVQVADHGLDRRDDQQHPHRHRQHLADGLVVAAAQQVPRRRGADEQRGGQERRHAHMQQAVGEGRVEDDREPVGRDHAAVDDLEAGRRLHPAVRRQDPSGGYQRAQRHHHRGKEMQARPDTVPAEQHHAQEAGLQEEGGQHFIGQQRPGDAAGELGKEAPVGAELVGHHQPGDDSHAEVDGKDLGPEVVEVAVMRALRAQPAAFQHRQVGGQADGDRRENNVEGNRERKLRAGEV
ncbi:hypothetical protein D3C72_1283930 [compost metagenome]